MCITYLSRDSCHNLICKNLELEGQSTLEQIAPPVTDVNPSSEKLKFG